MDGVRAVIAEDDVEQAEGVAALLCQLRPTWSIQALVHSRAAMVKALEEFVPDVLLLDLHIPEETPNQPGVLGMVAASAICPVVILVTGDPTRALEAYDFNAADYVVKPVRPARLAQALSRAENLLSSMPRRHSRAPLVAQPSLPVQWISGVRGRDIVMIQPVDIVYLRAEHKYTHAHLADGTSVLIRWGIAEIDAKLDASTFIRIHRSTIVNIKHIDFLRRDELGRLRMFMRERSGSLAVSRGFEHVFKGG